MDLITFNPIHKTHFLLHSLMADTQIKAVNQMYDYIYKLKETMEKKDCVYNNYTIEWYNYEKKNSFKSSFYGRDINNVLHKFYYGKIQERFKIYSIKLNPKA